MASLFVRNVNEWTKYWFDLNAGARSMKKREYLDALVTLHQSAKERAKDFPDVADLLEELGLSEVVA